MITDAMIEELKRQCQDEEAQGNAFRRMTPEKMTEQIRTRFHDPERAMMTQIEEAWKQVPKKEQDQETNRHIYALFVELASMLSGHFMREETEVFPLAQEASTGDTRLLTAQMELEHGEAEKKIQEITETANFFMPDSKNSGELNAFLKGLSELFAHIRKHVTVENDILFPEMSANFQDT